MKTVEKGLSDLYVVIVVSVQLFHL